MIKEKREKKHFVNQKQNRDHLIVKQAEKHVYEHLICGIIFVLLKCTFFTIL